MSPLELVLGKLPEAKRNGQNWQARCPGHDDKQASLSVKAGDDGRVLLKCFAGCPTEQIVGAMGLKLGDLFTPKNHNGDSAPRLLKVYSYTDRDGNVLHETCRFTPKSFRQRHPDGRGGHIWNLQGVELVLYRLADLMDADPEDWVFLCEGEKDVDRAWTEGMVSTCNAMGAGKWKPSYSETLRGRRVAIIPDRDEPGEKHAQAVRTALEGVAREVRIVRLADGMGKDLSDFFDAGGTKEMLMELVEQASAGTEPTKTALAGPEIAPVVGGLLDPKDPMGIARAIVAAKFAHADGPTIVRHKGEFYAFCGASYGELSEESARAMIYSHLERCERAVTIGDTEQIVPFQPTKHHVDQTIDALRAIVYTDREPVCWLRGNYRPDPHNLLVARNGIVDLAAASGPAIISRPTPNLFSFNAIDFDFNPNAPTPRTWLSFLDSIWSGDGDSIELLRQWFAYCLTSDTSLQKILLLIGPPRSGKGTICRVLTALLGQENVAGPTLSGIASNFGLWPLIGKMLAIISDARLSGRTDQAIVTERLLTISGEDSVTIDRKNREPMTVRLPTRLMLVSNELPRLADASGALANRFVTLRLTQSFLGREDTGLTDRLLGELPGILNWALAALPRLRADRRFIAPDSSADLTNEMQDLASPISAFLRDWTVERGRIPVKTLYDAWGVWCRQNGDRPSSIHVFGRDMRAARPGIAISQEQEQGARVRVYKGLDLTPPAKAELTHAQAIGGKEDSYDNE